MTVDGTKEFLKKLCLALKWGMSLLVLVLYALLRLEVFWEYTPETHL